MPAPVTPRLQPIAIPSVNLEPIIGHFEGHTTYRYTKHQIAERLFAGRDSIALKEIYWRDSNGRQHDGILLSVQREDGSGQSFNVTLQMPGGGYDTFHIRTID